ncbi:ATPase [Iodidimonas muriae]|uniref:ATPase n=1 Tax=Iodidimonas muriae TaxID=261467 RepID=A0ABQ2LEL3_9PROT|nr:ATP-binding protein [Iodidimonas muriae]GER08208.1 ATPase [Kordiimonadales bacterium JCM 17843]GGO12418.1 ATPase [Iodidimonas muriae]
MTEYYNDDSLASSREGGADAGQAPSVGLGRVRAVNASKVEILLEQGVDPSALGNIGGLLKIAIAPGCWVFGSIHGIDESAQGVVLHVDFVGETTRDGGPINRGVSSYPLPGDHVYPLDNDEMDLLFAPSEGLSVRIGTVYPGDVPAVIHPDNLLSKHFAVLGSTGTGKSSALALMIHRIVEQLPQAHILILDPHNEYAAAFSDIGVHYDPTTLSLPYWLMNFEEHIEVFIGQREASREVEVDILKRSLLAARKKSARHATSRITVDTPVPYKMTDLLSDLDTQMGRLEKPETLLPFLRLKHKIEELRSDERFGFMFSGMLINDTFPDIVARLLRMPSDGRPVSTLDLSGVPSDIVDVVVSLLCRMVFDFALWSRKGASARPLLLVCEEAHRYVPRTQKPRFDSARRVIERIAKEGRKYGVSLGLVSQRPSDVSESVLSQCGTILSMRMNNERDAAFVASAMPEGSETFLNSISSLRNRECILCGEGVAVPMRVRLDYLADNLRPSSADPAFSENWADGSEDVSFVRTVIERWRSGGAR